MRQALCAITNSRDAAPRCRGGDAHHGNRRRGVTEAVDRQVFPFARGLEPFDETLESERRRLRRVENRELMLEEPVLTTATADIVSSHQATMLAPLSI